MDGEALHVLENIVTAGMAATTIIFAAYSPIARAIGKRIMHGKLPPEGAQFDDHRVDGLSGEVTALRQAMYEQQERLDFAERLLAQARERGVLGSGKDG